MTWSHGIQQPNQWPSAAPQDQAEIRKYGEEDRVPSLHGEPVAAWYVILRKNLPKERRGCPMRQGNHHCLRIEHRRALENEVGAALAVSSVESVVVEKNSELPLQRVLVENSMNREKAPSSPA
ncbi:hypothetical protein N9S22_04525 [Paracoccaceae bacterium]|nr:hypothetical protein [Paracoccaceae bacterium]